MTLSAIEYLYRPMYRPAHNSAFPPDVTWDYVEAPATDPIIAVRRGLPLSRQPFGVIADESRIDEKLRQLIAAADAEADRNDGREPGDTRDEESLEDHNIQGLGAYRDVFDAGGEQ